MSRIKPKHRAFILKSRCFYNKRFISCLHLLLRLLGFIYTYCWRNKEHTTTKCPKSCTATYNNLAWPQQYNFQTPHCKRLIGHSTMLCSSDGHIFQGGVGLTVCMSTTTINKQIIKTYSITGKCIQLDRFLYTEKSPQCHIVCFSSILL